MRPSRRTTPGPTSRSRRERIESGPDSDESMRLHTSSLRQPIERAALDTARIMSSALS
jgi:hypothetical protein